MLSMNDNFRDLDILQETVVDKLLDVFNDYFRLKLPDLDSNELLFQLNVIIRDQGIKLKIAINPSRTDIGASGVYYADKNEIVLELPRNKVNLRKFTVAFFHEYIHCMRENIVPGKFNPTERNLVGYVNPIDLKYIGNQYGYYGLFLERDHADEKMYQMLKYWTQPHERSNIAFNIAYDLYFDTAPFKVSTFDDIIDAGFEIWKLYNQTKSLKYLDIFKHQFKSSPGVMTLLAVIFYRQELNSKQKLDRQLKTNVPKMIDLARRYYKRLGGILNNSSNSKIAIFS